MTSAALAAARSLSALFSIDGLIPRQAVPSAWLSVANWVNWPTVTPDPVERPWNSDCSAC